MRHPPPAAPLGRARFAACPAVLQAIRDDAVNLAVWRRGPAGRLRAVPPWFIPFSVRGEGPPRQAASSAARACPKPLPARARGALGAMARRFAAVTGALRIAVRIDGVADDACRRFHADAVGLRLLWTWAGRGTELIPPGETRIRRLRAGDVALLKGEAWPGNQGRGAIHRSPPVAHLPRRRRARLLVVMDTLDAE
jgi:hypothetical protein